MATKNNQESKIIKNNSDFLFIYEAIMTNPNGDPDQENKPRMDYDTHTNLVTDVRIKRYIRDYLKAQGEEIFVSMEGDKKVKVDNKIERYYNSIRDNIENLSLTKEEKDFISKCPTSESLFDYLKIKTGDKDKQKEMKTSISKKILKHFIQNNWIDIRMFGSAFAVDKLPTIPITGAIQLSWGYSLNKVYLVKSDTIVSIMEEGSSTFGKDYRVYYSLLAFYGTINKYAAQSSFLTENDIKEFRKAIWNSLNAIPTRSKQGQYPLLYLEIQYNNDYNNNLLGDLRQYIKVKPKNKITDEQVRKLEDLEIDFSELIKKINENENYINTIHYKIDSRLNNFISEIFRDLNNRNEKVIEISFEENKQIKENE